MTTTVYDYSFMHNNGQEVSFDDYAGKVVLIVNTASKCGFTPQYEGLETLYRQFKDRDFVIIGFPCDQFKHQEPGNNEEIAQFCQKNYGVSFPLSSKIDVNGDNALPLFSYLKEEAAGIFGSKNIKWNFTKFLISKDGKVLKRYAPITKPSDIEKDIVPLLSEA